MIQRSDPSIIINDAARLNALIINLEQKISLIAKKMTRNEPENKVTHLELEISSLHEKFENSIRSLDEKLDTKFKETAKN